MGKAAQRQFLVRSAAVSGYFARKTGGHLKSATTKSFDGGSLVPEVLASPPEADNITLSRDYDPDRDEPILRQLRGVCGRLRTTLSIQPTDEDLAPTQPPVVYPNSLLVEVNEPDVDAASGTAARFELVWGVTNPA